MSPLIIAGFEVDVALVEEPTFPSEITSFPVETGSDVSDNQRLLPAELNVEGLISDTPIGAIADRRDPGTIPSEEAYRFFKELRVKRQPFTVETHRDVFDNMLLETLTPPTLSHDGLRFRAMFRQVELLDNERTTIPVGTPAAARKAKRGSKVPKPGMTVEEAARRRGFVKTDGSGDVQAMYDHEAKFRNSRGREAVKLDDPTLFAPDRAFPTPFSSF